MGLYERINKRQRKYNGSKKKGLDLKIEQTLNLTLELVRGNEIEQN